MNEDKEKWINDVFKSMEGAEKAHPDGQLIAKIEGHIFGDEGKVISLVFARIAAAAAIALLAINILVYRHYVHNSSIAEQDIAYQNTANQRLISNYKIYE